MQLGLDYIVSSEAWAGTLLDQSDSELNSGPSYLGSH